VYLPEFLALGFPAIHAAVDWSRPYRFLETELQRVAVDDQHGRRTADKLVEVWRRDGVAAWVLLHLEVQSQAGIARVHAPGALEIATSASSIAPSSPRPAYGHPQTSAIYGHSVSNLARLPSAAPVLAKRTR
jgi:hypothetical protein